jgi:hypothetical protein
MRSSILLAGALLACAMAVPHESLGARAKPVLPWIEDDYARAVADAKARKVPMFVESWAPW